MVVQTSQYKLKRGFGIFVSSRPPKTSNPTLTFRLKGTTPARAEMSSSATGSC